MPLGAAHLALLTCLASAPPSGEARWLMLVGERPVAELSIAWDADAYRYRSRQLLPTLRSRARLRLVELPLQAGRAVPSGLVPELLLLAHRPPRGCHSALEELSKTPERVCVDDDGAGGTIDGERFSARWGADGRLAELALPGTRFVATVAPLPAEAEADPFAKGFPVGQTPELTARAAVEPPLSGVVVLPRPPVGELDSRAPDQAGNCLELALARARARRELAVVRGVVLEGGRAWPHAWLHHARSGRSVDPSLPPGAPELAERTYVAFPEDEAGRLYLELLSGRRRVVVPGAHTAASGHE